MRENRKLFVPSSDPYNIVPGFRYFPLFHFRRTRPGQGPQLFPRRLHALPILLRDIGDFRRPKAPAGILVRDLVDLAGLRHLCQLYAAVALVILINRLAPGVIPTVSLYA